MSLYIKNTSEYLRGQSDAKHGEDADINGCKDYIRGYALQYEAEQQLTDMGLRQDKKMGIRA